MRLQLCRSRFAFSRRNKGTESKSESPRGEGDHEKPAEARKFVDKFPPNEKETEREREIEFRAVPHYSLATSQSARQAATGAVLSINGDINGR